LDELIFSFLIYWIEVFGDPVHIRLYNYLLSSWLYYSIGDVTSRTYNSFSYHFWFFYNSIYYGLWFWIDCFNWNFIKVQIQLICLVAVYGQCQCY